MRRTNRFTAPLLLAALLLVAAAPAASAAPWPALSDLDGFGRTLATWWAALAGGDGATRGVAAASEVTPSIDPNGDKVTPSLDPDGDEVTPHLDPDGNEVTPRLDPDG
jgi:hypothetical protein